MYQVCFFNLARVWQTYFLLFLNIVQVHVNWHKLVIMHLNLSYGLTVKKKKFENEILLDWSLFLTRNAPNLIVGMTLCNLTGFNNPAEGSTNRQA